MGALLSHPDTTPLLFRGQLVSPACVPHPAISPTATTSSSTCINAHQPHAYHIEFGCASIQGWRKYQEDRVGFLHLSTTPLQPPCPSTPATPCIRTHIVEDVESANKIMMEDDEQLQCRENNIPHMHNIPHSPYKSPSSPCSSTPSPLDFLWHISSPPPPSNSDVSSEERSVEHNSNNGKKDEKQDIVRTHVHSTVNLLMFSIFDGHGGSPTSQFCYEHFHTFLQHKIEKAMKTWRKNKHFNEKYNFPASKLSSRRSSMNDISQASMCPPPTPPVNYPITQQFLTQLFLEFDQLLTNNPNNTTASSSSSDTSSNPDSPSLSTSSSTTSTSSTTDHKEESENNTEDEDSKPAPPIRTAPINVVKLPLLTPHYTSGSTCTLCMIDLDHHLIIFAHVGDSRVIEWNCSQLTAPLASQRASASSYYSSIDPMLQYVSVDHSPDEPSERKRITARTYKNTYVHVTPPVSRVVHRVEKMSLNVVRGFGDLHFKREKKCPQRNQIVCAAPDVFTSMFPAYHHTLAPTSLHRATSLPASQHSISSLSEQREHKKVGKSSSSSRPSTPPPTSRTLHNANSNICPTDSPLFICLASDGIWNSQFPLSTPGIRQKFGGLSESDVDISDTVAYYLSLHMVPHTDGVQQRYMQLQTQYDNQWKKKMQEEETGDDVDSTDVEILSDFQGREGVIASLSAAQYWKAVHADSQHHQQRRGKHKAEEELYPTTHLLQHNGSIDYSQLSFEMLKELIAKPPLNKDKMKSTDNMSAIIISITPLSSSNNTCHPVAPLLMPHTQQKIDVVHAAGAVEGDVLSCSDTDPFCVPTTVSSTTSLHHSPYASVSNIADQKQRGPKTSMHFQFPASPAATPPPPTTLPSSSSALPSIKYSSIQHLNSTNFSFPKITKDATTSLPPLIYPDTHSFTSSSATSHRTVQHDNDHTNKRDIPTSSRVHAYLSVAELTQHTKPRMFHQHKSNIVSVKKSPVQLVGSFKHAKQQEQVNLIKRTYNVEGHKSLKHPHHSKHKHSHSQHHTHNATVASSNSHLNGSNHGNVKVSHSNHSDDTRHHTHSNHSIPPRVSPLLEPIPPHSTSTTHYTSGKHQLQHDNAQVKKKQKLE